MQYWTSNSFTNFVSGRPRRAICSAQSVYAPHGSRAHAVSSALGGIAARDDAGASIATAR